MTHTLPESVTKRIDRGIHDYIQAMESGALGTLEDCLDNAAGQIPASQWTVEMDAYANQQARRYFHG